MTSKLEKALNDPKSVFGEPSSVLDADFLTGEQKRDALSRWEADSRELHVASEEGMSGGEPAMLQQVRAALRAIGEDDAAGAPTKQGG